MCVAAGCEGVRSVGGACVCLLGVRVCGVGVRA
jgi:hypothetical protein